MTDPASTRSAFGDRCSHRGIVHQRPRAQTSVKGSIPVTHSVYDLNNPVATNARWYSSLMTWHAARRRSMRNSNLCFSRTGNAHRDPTWKIRDLPAAAAARISLSPQPMSPWRPRPPRMACFPCCEATVTDRPSKRMRRSRRQQGGSGGEQESGSGAAHPIRVHGGARCGVRRPRPRHLSSRNMRRRGRPTSSHRTSSQSPGPVTSRRTMPYSPEAFQDWGAIQSGGPPQGCRVRR